MKKSLLLCIFSILSTVFLCAQQQNDILIIEKGTWFIAGSVALSNNQFTSENRDSSTDQNSFDLTVAPKIGFTLKNNVMIGLGLDYLRDKGETFITRVDSENSGGSGISQALSISPFVRTYFGLNHNLTLFIQGELLYRRRWSESSDDNDPSSLFTSSNNQFSAGFRPGLTYFLSKKLALETTLGFLRYSRFDSEATDSASGSGSNFSLSLNSSDLLFGISYYF